MGLRPSSPPPRPDEASNGQSLGGPPAQGPRSSNVRRISRGAGGAECADGEVSAPGEIALGYRDYQERRLREEAVQALYLRGVFHAYVVMP